MRKKPAPIAAALSKVTIREPPASQLHTGNKMGILQGEGNREFSKALALTLRQTPALILLFTLHNEDQRKVLGTQRMMNSGKFTSTFSPYMRKFQDPRC